MTLYLKYYDGEYTCKIWQYSKAGKIKKKPFKRILQNSLVFTGHIGMIERAEKNITLINIEKISKALKMPIDELVKFNDS